MFFSSFEARDVLRDLLRTIDEEEPTQYREEDPQAYLRAVIGDEGGQRDGE